ncbi:MAG TPA: aminopeptidase P N-terminal domain-containing protein, partial [Gemmatimonadales bacterium]|nr:aminopeptidase P N-terminal domain-containing protein [Gemmatimonadales bacterium]
MAESKTDNRNANRSTTPVSDTFKKYISQNWAERADVVPAPREQAAFAAARRLRISRLYPGKRIIVPAGASKVRSNDTDYAYRAHSAFAHLTGWGSDSEPGAVLVLEPEGTGHRATVYFRERADRTSDEFYANPAIGEFWIGPRPSLAQVAGDLGLDT